MHWRVSGRRKMNCDESSGTIGGAAKAERDLFNFAATNTIT